MMLSKQIPPSVICHSFKLVQLRLWPHPLVDPPPKLDIEATFASPHRSWAQSCGLLGQLKPRMDDVSPPCVPFQTQSPASPAIPNFNRSRSIQEGPSVMTRTPSAYQVALARLSRRHHRLQTEPGLGFFNNDHLHWIHIGSKTFCFKQDQRSGLRAVK